MRSESDVDYRDALFGIPESEIAAREAEREREQRWAEFVAEMRQLLSSPDIDFVDLLKAVGVAKRFRDAGDAGRWALMSPHYQMIAFAETEGWDGVLNAIARAMREEEQYRRELVDRR